MLFIPQRRFKQPMTLILTTIHRRHLQSPGVNGAVTYLPVSMVQSHLSASVSEACAEWCWRQGCCLSTGGGVIDPSAQTAPLTGLSYSMRSTISECMVLVHNLRQAGHSEAVRV